MAAQPESLPGCSVAPPGQAPWSTLPGFLYYSVTFFLFYSDYDYSGILSLR